MFKVITSCPSNLVPIPDGCNEHCKELIAAVPADTEILAMDTVGSVVLIGTTKVGSAKDTEIIAMETVGSVVLIGITVYLGIAD